MNMLETTRIWGNWCSDFLCCDSFDDFSWDTGIECPRTWQVKAERFLGQWNGSALQARKQPASACGIPAAEEFGLEKKIGDVDQ